MREKERYLCITFNIVSIYINLWNETSDTVAQLVQSYMTHMIHLMYNFDLIYIYFIGYHNVEITWYFS